MDINSIPPITNSIPPITFVGKKTPQMGIFDGQEYYSKLPHVDVYVGQKTHPAPVCSTGLDKILFRKAVWTQTTADYHTLCTSTM